MEVTEVTELAAPAERSARGTGPSTSTSTFSFTRVHSVGRLGTRGGRDAAGFVVDDFIAREAGVVWDVVVEKKNAS